jgi:GNAT superfamily N-acetyltransferase
MDRISPATGSALEKAVGFLERRGLLENAWLLSHLEPARLSPAPWKVLVCRRKHEIVGVAIVLDYRAAPPPTGRKTRYAYEAHMDCVDRSALEALLEALPPGEWGRFALLSPAPRGYLEAAPGVHRGDTDFYFTVSAARFRPVEGEEVIELTAADGHLFEGCERADKGDPLAVVRHGSGRKFAILREGRAVTSAGIAPIVHKTPRRCGVMAIAGVSTESRYRRMGFGKRLVSHVTELILADGHLPMYWTSPDNLASQALAKALGYWQYGTMTTYLWKRP